MTALRLIAVIPEVPSILPKADIAHRQLCAPILDVSRIRRLLRGSLRPLQKVHQSCFCKRVSAALLDAGLQIAEIATELTRLRYTGPSHRQSLPFEGAKSICYVMVPVQRGSQRSRVFDCLDDGPADVRTCEHCRITNQGDLAEGKRGAFEVIDRLQERLVHEAQRSGDFRRQ